MRVTLRGPVGDLSGTRRQGNYPDDVRAVRRVLEELGLLTASPQSRTVTQETIDAIRKFQEQFAKNPDGRVDPGGKTLGWLNDLSTGKTIVIDLRRQVLTAYSDLQQVLRYHCASGDRAHPTPVGVYKVYRKHRKYRSRSYDAQMDYAMFFYRGYAIHMAYAVSVTSHLKWAGFDMFGSHGCVRLAESDARRLFAWTPMGTPVQVRKAGS